MRQPERLRTTSTVTWLWGISAVAVATRVAAALYLGNEVTPLPGIFDQTSYHTLALRVLDGHGFSFGEGWWPVTPANQPTAHWSYLYVSFLAGIYAVAGPNPLVARLVQAVAVGVLQPLLTYRIGRRLFGRRVGLAAAAVAACYAYFVYYAAALVTEALCIVALLWSVDVAMGLVETAETPERSVRRVRWLHLGLALGVAVLLRQVILLTVPVILGWVAWRILRGPGHDSRRRELLVGLVTCVLVMAACVLPWTVRNYRAFHRFVLLNTNAGFAFYWGNHPIHGTSFMPLYSGGASAYLEVIPEELRGLNEAELERALLARGLAFVAQDPERVFWLSVSRIQEYLKFWPSRGSGAVSNLARVLSFGLCLPFLVWGIVLSLVKRPRSPGVDRCSTKGGLWLLYGVVFTYSAIHLLTWTLVRYRLPVDAVLMPFAGLSLIWTLDWLWRHARHGRLVSQPATSAS
jgi:4-amino-4-deoxy-L-arabinose transferase-like glycosyltransferase